jgi:hypothetical protein
VVSRSRYDQLRGISNGVEPRDESVVKADRDDRIDLAVEPENQRGHPNERDPA